MKTRGRPVLGAIAGLFFGIFLAFDLIMVKAVASDSPVILVLPIVMLIVGIVLGMAAPLGRGRAGASGPAGPAPAPASE